MISLRNTIFIFVLLTFLDSIISVCGITKCEKNILADFEYIEKQPGKIRFDMPRRAFLRKTINNLTNEDAKHYFEHLHNLVNYKESMLLPREFCDARTKSLKLRGEDEYEKCVEIMMGMQNHTKFLKDVRGKYIYIYIIYLPDQSSRQKDLLCSTFKDSDDKTELIKSTFWDFTEGMISKFDKTDYRYRYYYYLCGKIIYSQFADQKSPMTIKQLCASLYPDEYNEKQDNKSKEKQAASLKSFYEFKLTKEEALQYCTTKIFKDFEITTLWKQQRARIFMPKTAFLTFVEDDFESPDAKDYHYHINGVIKAKEGTENPRQYCNTITKETQEEKKCVGYLLSMYLDSDATTVLKDAFQNFKKSHFAKNNELDYRVRYFYYLSGNFEFYKIENFRDTPLTPVEFCRMDRTEALNPRILMESESVEKGHHFALVDRHKDIK